jgi:hypothetical protein
MKLSIILIRTAGAICLLFAIFHVFFHKLFNWPESLSCLDVNNRAILLTYHYISILILGFMAITAIFQAKAILKSQLNIASCLCLPVLSHPHLCRIFAIRHQPGHTGYFNHLPYSGYLFCLTHLYKYNAI